MFSFKKVEAKTIDDAIQQVLTEKEIGKNDLIFNVIDEGKHGILGMGHKPAIIEFITKDEIITELNEFITDIFERMSILNVTVTSSFDEERMNFDINSEQNGLIIGKDGQTLQAIQFLVSQIVRNTFPDNRYHIFIDVSGYRKESNEKLIQYATRMAYKVAKYKENIELRPMNSFQRRIIHEALMNDKFVTTESAGVGLDRHIVIKLK